MAFVREYHFIGADFHNTGPVDALAHRVNLAADKHFLADNAADSNFITHFAGRVFNARKLQLAQTFRFFAFASFFRQFALAFRFKSGQTLLFPVLQ